MAVSAQWLAEATMTPAENIVIADGLNDYGYHEKDVGGELIPSRRLLRGWKVILLVAATGLTKHNYQSNRSSWFQIQSNSSDEVIKKTSQSLNVQGASTCSKFRFWKFIVMHSNASQVHLDILAN